MPGRSRKGERDDPAPAIDVLAPHDPASLDGKPDGRRCSGHEERGLTVPTVHHPDLPPGVVDEGVA